MLKNQSFTQNVNSCKICKKSYIAMNLLTQYTLSVHEKQRFPWTFENCEKTFAMTNGVKIHLKRHIGTKSKMCKKCLKMFFHESEVRVHMLSHYENQFHCDMCKNKSCRNKLELNQHKKSCQKLLSCCYCEKNFKGEKTLKNISKGNILHVKIGITNVKYVRQNLNLHIGKCSNVTI